MKKSKKTLLLIEDEKNLIDLIKLKFEKDGFEVVYVQTCEEALERFHNLKQLDVVWLDHHLLGKKNGLDFVAEARANKAKKTIPIFVVSNTGDHKKKKTYMQLGATDYYIKANHKLDDIVREIEEGLN